MLRRIFNFLVILVIIFAISWIFINLYNSGKKESKLNKLYEEYNDNYIGFDIKGTVIPKSMRGDVEGVINNQQRMVDFFLFLKNRFGMQITGIGRSHVSRH